VSEIHLDGEVVAEESVDAQEGDSVRALPLPYEEPGSSLALSSEVRSAALAAAGGVLAGAATVAAVRVVSSVGSRAGRSPRRVSKRRDRRDIVASRSFLVDVHLLGR